MLLAIDIGNSNIKCGIFTDSKLVSRSAYKNFSSFVSFLKKNKPCEYAICSVAPPRLRKVKKVLRSISSFEPFIITKDVKFNLKIEYKSTETLGMDRLCSAEGAFYLQKEKGFNANQCMITIDFGTATTINLIKYPNVFAGGVIAPGIKTMFKSLHSNTAQLPKVNVDNYKFLIGDDTVSSIASGVVNSTVGMIERTIEQLYKNEKCNEVIIYLTGGLAEKIQPFLSGNVFLDNSLVLKGINAVYELNRD